MTAYPDHPLDQIRRKLSRADEHLAALDELIEDFIGLNPYRPFVDMDMQAQQSLIRVKIHERPDVLEWGVLIGEVLYQLRTALDHIAWRLGGDPPPNPGSSEFPIALCEHWYRRKGIQKIVGVPERPKAIIEELQPYHRGKRAESHALWVLHRLHADDKHKLLHITGAVIDGVAYFTAEAPIGDDFSGVQFGPFEDGAIIAGWPWDPGKTAPGHKPEVGVPFHFIFGIAFEQIGPAPGRNVVKTLTKCRDFVRDEAIPRLAPFL